MLFIVSLLIVEFNFILYFVVFSVLLFLFFFNQKTEYDLRISDWSSDVCSSDSNSGDAAEDLTFHFRFTNTYKGLAVPTGASANVAVPLSNIGAIDKAGANLNVTESYTLSLIKGDRRTGTRMAVTGDGGETSFQKPSDNIGVKSIPDYAAYANQFIFNVTIPGCDTKGRVFVGQRHDGFVVNLGHIFDLINLNPLGARNSSSNTIADKNVTSLALEVPATCLTKGSDPVIGAWTTASLPQSRVLNPDRKSTRLNSSH